MKIVMYTIFCLFYSFPEIKFLFKHFTIEKTINLLNHLILKPYVLFIETFTLY